MLFKFASLVTLIASTYLTLPQKDALPGSRARLPLNNPSNNQEEIVLNLETKKGPIKNPNMLGVELTAKAAVVLDKESGQVLFEKKAHTRLPQASLTKIMTAVVVLDNKPKLDDIMVVSANPLQVQPLGADLALRKGEEISVHDLLRSLLIVSANDAAITLAEYTAGSEKLFVELMNQKAQALGLQNTHFQNTHGLDQEKHFSTAYDLAQITRYALNKKVFRETIVMPRYVFETSVRTHWIKNTNKLLNNTYLNITGGKTGFTDNAGLCLIEIAQNNQGNEIIAVVLNSQNQWQEAKGLLDWTFRAYTWQ